MQFPEFTRDSRHFRPREQLFAVGVRREHVRHAGCDGLGQRHSVLFRRCEQSRARIIVDLPATAPPIRQLVPDPIYSAMSEVKPDALQVTAGRSHTAVIRVYDAAGKMIETHENKGDFKEP